ncbi:response regulator [Pseudomonas nitroreducens]|uniref:response regulator n=1 Tax=Pseudomonas nitroreducens TaxID=46680 RepID=UPI001FB74A5D|nr:response regulator [Pseudomonas nitroreducens]MCJ1879644.1 response regulator [Pseudomonas nitroreducens]MCJ1896805.1 response regulator [Pseudomonas nitroreducens]
MARILIADEHPMTCYAVRTLLQEERHTVVGEARNGLEALSLTTRLSPDLLIIDIDLSQITGLDVISRLRARGLTLPILGYSTQDSEHYVGRFLQVGASGFVSKHQEVEQLKEALAVVLRGHSYFPAETLGSVHLGSLQENDAERVASLSNRELSVLSLLASGYSNQEIARELTISEKSVSTYRARMRSKLNLTSMLDLIDFARRNRLAAPAGLTASERGGEGEAPLWRSMVESLPAAFYVRDTEARLVYANPAHLKLYHASLDEVLGTRTTEVDWYPPDDASNMLRFLQRAIAQEQPFSKDIEITIHGERRVLHHWGTPYRDQDGNLVGMICCSTDITERYDQLNELRIRAEANELAHQQLTDLFTSATIHLNERLEALAGTLAQSDTTALGEAHTILEELLVHGASLKCALIAQEEVPPLPTYLDELAAEVLSVLHVQADQKQLPLKLEASTRLRKALLVDAQSLREALRHLGLYVIDLTDDGSVRLRIAATQKQQQMGVRITLEGLPIDERHEMRAYSLSELTRDYPVRKQARNSLSLNIAQHLINNIGGELQISHLPGQGCCATVHLLLSTPSE